MAGRLQGKTTLITAAGAGIGRATAIAFANEGATVHATDVNDKLFADYEQRFLKRNVQGELIARALNPIYWGDLSSTAWGRSELAAQLYDEGQRELARLQRGARGEDVRDAGGRRTRQQLGILAFELR